MLPSGSRLRPSAQGSGPRVRGLAPGASAVSQSSYEIKVLLIYEFLMKHLLYNDVYDYKKRQKGMLRKV